MISTAGVSFECGGQIAHSRKGQGEGVHYFVSWDKKKEQCCFTLQKQPTFPATRDFLEKGPRDCCFLYDRRFASNILSFNLHIQLHWAHA